MGDTLNEIEARAWVTQSAFRAKPAKRKYVGLHRERGCGSLARAARDSGGVVEVPSQFWREFQPCSACAIRHPDWRWYPNATTSPALREWWTGIGDQLLAERAERTVVSTWTSFPTDRGEAVLETHLIEADDRLRELGDDVLALVGRVRELEAECDRRVLETAEARTENIRLRSLLDDHGVPFVGASKAASGEERDD